MYVMLILKGKGTLLEILLRVTRWAGELLINSIVNECEDG